MQFLLVSLLGGQSRVEMVRNGPTENMGGVLPPAKYSAGMLMASIWHERPTVQVFSSWDERFVQFTVSGQGNI